MSNDTIFREIDSLISVVEYMQRELTTSTFDALKIVEEELPYLRIGRIQSWVESKSGSFFQFAHAINRKAEKFAGNYSEFIKPASLGSYVPVGIDINDKAV